MSLARLITRTRIDPDPTPEPPTYTNPNQQPPPDPNCTCPGLHLGGNPTCTLHGWWTTDTTALDLADLTRELRSPWDAAVAMFGGSG